MENNDYFIGNLMDRIILLAMFCSTVYSVINTTQTDEEMVAKILRHKPTKENMEDLYALRKENEAQKKTQQREIDKEKLRHYLMEGNVL
jgi:hypothetical protein